ncbi:LacI family transcriptional regulator [Kribbella aluminosa]|uniref:LacI family transcriptional regulator n=1 Tax=Kribbella aluminosa TaxID=416017 RepID=A0ABS4UD70_9ACTN|nr:LacI family DNA-binding transcriptional regulator [Kribbella aluminosa]MBP2349582.1 LacI family transcriptional regulator [Kribbella aluminosa]
MASRGIRPAGIKDVARLAGVSASTVSKALNGNGQLRETTRERIRDAAEQLGFTPDSRGRALASGRSFTVGLITTDSSGRFSIPIMLGAEDALTAGEMGLVLCDTRDDPLREQHYLKSLVSRRVDGIIVTGRRVEPRAPIDVPIPVVYAFSPSTDPSDTSVVVDDHAGAASTVRHLHTVGRKRIAHVTGPESHLSARIRAAATQEAASTTFAGQPLFGEWSERWGRLAVDVLLREHPEVDAITCGSDQIARGVCDRLRELGRSVPGDIAVTGYDNWSVMALASRPPLTTVDMELEELGRRTANLLLDAIAGSPHPGPLRLPTRLIPRESTLGT